MRSILIDLILPSRCAGCALPGTSWCADCRRQLSGPFPVDRDRGDLPPTYALGHYRGAPRRLVLAYKERGRRELAGVLGRAFASALPALPAARAGPAGWVLVPAPSRPGAARSRGGQHMAVVARRCAAALTRAGQPAACAPALRLDARARDSVGLDATERAANLAGRLRPYRVPPPGTPVVLLDDVVTTGATAAACTSVLAAAGVPVTAVLAYTAAG